MIRIMLSVAGGRLAMIRVATHQRVGLITVATPPLLPVA